MYAKKFKVFLLLSLENPEIMRVPLVPVGEFFDL